MSTSSAAEMFESGPFPHFQRTLGLFRPVGHSIIARSILTIGVGWFPLVGLIIAQSLAGYPSLFGAFTRDAGLHARSFIAAPLLVISEWVCLQRLTLIVQHFSSAGIVADEEKAEFDSVINTGRRTMNSTVIEVLVILLAYLLVFKFVWSVPENLPSWYSITRDGNEIRSWAGWWAAWITLPLLLILIFGWFWRIVLWGWFLFRVSRMKLRLITAHPDGAAGLKFLNSAILAYTPIAFTFGVIAAGSVANRVLNKGASVQEVQRTVIGVLIFVLILIVGPVLVFSTRLFAEKIKGVFLYSQLADRVGRQFELKWLQDSRNISEDALEVPDFSATTDLYQVVANVYQIRVLPFELKALVVLAVSTLVPFIPVAVMFIPLREIVKDIVSLFL